MSTKNIYNKNRNKEIKVQNWYKLEGRKTNLKCSTQRYWASKR